MAAFVFWVVFFNGSFPLSFAGTVTVFLAKPIGPPQAILLPCHSYDFGKAKMPSVLLDLLKALMISPQVVTNLFFLEPVEAVVYLLLVRKSYRAYFPRNSSFPHDSVWPDFPHIISQNHRCDCGQPGCDITDILVILNSLSHCI